MKHYFHVIRYREINGEHTLWAYHKTKPAPIFKAEGFNGLNAYENLLTQLSKHYPKGGEFELSYFDVSDCKALKPADNE